jgi:hypothetical protein
MKAAPSITASARPSPRTVGLACTLLMALSTGCSLERAVPAPTTPSTPFSTGGLTVGPPTAVRPGEVVTAAVVAGDPHCYPSWDANARCRTFKVVAPASGVVSATLRGSSPTAVMELFSIPGGQPAKQDPDLDLSWQLSWNAVVNDEIYFMVMAYRFPEPFTLQIDLK